MLNFNAIFEGEITVRHLNVYGNAVPILPPEPYLCVRGARQYSRLYYVTGGRTIFNRGKDNELSAGKGDIVYLPHDVEYSSEWEVGTEGAFLTVNFILNEPAVVFSSDICIAASDSSGKLLKLFEKILGIWTKGSFNYRPAALSVFWEILALLSQEASMSSLESGAARISEGIMYIESHFCEEFSVDYLCGLCAVSPATFRRLFKRYSRYSPMTYRNFLRVQRAKELLESGEYNVTEAASAVGFEDLSYFNKTFRRFIGKNPSAVREK